MRKWLFLTATLLFIGWGLCFFLFKAGMAVHVIFIASAIMYMHGIIVTPGSGNAQ